MHILIAPRTDRCASRSRSLTNGRRAALTARLAAGALLASPTGVAAQHATLGVPTRSAQGVHARDDATSAMRPRELTLDSVYALLAARSPRVRAAVARARAASARIPGATRPGDPVLQLGAMNYSLPRLRPDAALGMLQLQVMQMIPTPGKLGAAASVARERADAERERAADAWWEARVVAATAFYERHQASGAARLARDTRRLLEDVAATAIAMYRVGEGRQPDVLRARVEIARMDEEIVRMEATLAAATARLAAALDTTTDAVDGVPLLPSFPDTVPGVAALEALAYDARPMLAAGAAEVRAAEADARLARRELWPDLQVGVQYGQRRMEPGTDRMASVMIGGSLPIFARARQLRMRDEADAMRAMARAELAAMRAETRSRITEGHAVLLSTRRLRLLYRTTVLPQAEATAVAALASYRSGTVDFMTVLESQMSVNRFRQALLALDTAEGRSWSELELLVGRPLLAAPDPAPMELLRRLGDASQGGLR